MDPDTGEIFPGRYDEPSPVDCKLERTLAATLVLSSLPDVPPISTYVALSVDLDELDAACPVYVVDAGGDDPGLFSRADLFKRRSAVATAGAGPGLPSMSPVNGRSCIVRPPTAAGPPRRPGVTDPQSYGRGASRAWFRGTVSGYSH